MSQAAPINTTPVDGPSSGRRGFLRGLVTLPLIGGGVTLIGNPTAAAVPAENPELIQLGRRLIEAEAAWKQAEEHRQQVRALCAQMWPSVPEGLLRSREVPVATVTLTDMDDKEVRPYRWIYLAGSLRESATHDYGCGPRSKAGRAIRKLIPVAEAYEAARKHAKEMSGFEAAETAAYHRRCDIETVAADIAEAPAHTAEGLRIKAAALAIWAGDKQSELYYRAALVSGPALAQAVLAVLGPASSSAVEG